MGSVDTKRLSGEVAARHGLLIREDDPAMALVTMSEIVLEQVLSEAELRLRGLLVGGRKRPEEVATRDASLGSRRNGACRKCAPGATSVRY